MNEFQQVKNNWKEQPIEEASVSDFLDLKRRIKRLAGKQRITNVILLSTVGILGVFFFYIGAIDFSDVAFAIGTMIAALVIRVLVEFFSIGHLRNMTATTSIQDFKVRLQRYYRNRIWVHLVLTPLLLAIYSFAFWTLLPDFKVSLSKGFYNYIVYSSMVLLVFFVLLIGNDVRKELNMLGELKRD